MSADLSPMREPANPRLRGAITTILMIMLVFMIVRDVFARRRDRRERLADRSRRDISLVVR
jgi:hypothetical protein